jgi:hypothetical protein
MSKIEGTYYCKNPSVHLQVEALALNVSGVTEEARLLQLGTGAGGGVLLVTQLLGKDGAAQSAFITVLEVPSAVTYSHGVDDAGHIFADIWDKAIIANFPASADSSVANYPVTPRGSGRLLPCYCYSNFQLRSLVFLWMHNLYSCLRVNNEANWF